MEIFKRASDMREWSDQMHRVGETISFVPTMGYLHEGHLSLIEKGKSVSSSLVVSIFVNPAQFGENEDLNAYPTNIERDIELIKKKGANALFLPDKKEIYSENYQTYISLEYLPNHLCGLSRPVHFRGVATIVAKLFNIVRPDAAIFGAKDFQQLQVIRQLNRDLNFGINIIGSPIVRENDGLAMSSRNAYLTPEQRQSALSLSQSLLKAKEIVKSGERYANIIKSNIRNFIDSFPYTKIDYISICDPDTLNELIEIDREFLFALAVQVGKARLIDNMLIKPIS
ncbi:MAG: pantoate--beta-alanine ligase [Desulfamplus sp.]|nr:pantoate--beta-alanine ligase [Desulfamplus sp.]